MKGFEKVAQIDEITSTVPKCIKIGESEVVLFRVNGQIFAIENLCPHQRYAAFHLGILEQYNITCPMHGWSFDLRTGKAVVGSGRLKILELHIDKNDVWVRKNEDENDGVLDHIE